MSKHNLEDYERTHCLVIFWSFSGAPVHTELTKYLGHRHFQAQVLCRNLRMLVPVFFLEEEGNLFI